MPATGPRGGAAGRRRGRGRGRAPCRRDADAAAARCGRRRPTRGDASVGRWSRRGRMSTVRADLLVTGPDRDARGPGRARAGSRRSPSTGGRVVAAGSAADVEGLVGPGTRRLALAPDEVAIPGLTDAHLHLAEAALARRRVNLDGARSIDDGHRACPRRRGGRARRRRLDRGRRLGRGPARALADGR